MKMSKRVEYGLRALLDLAQRNDPMPVQSGDVAARQKIPEPYLQQLFLALRRAGLVRSFRGPQGGHRLARRPDRITLAEAVNALEGSLVAPRKPAARPPEEEPLEAEVVREVWWQLEATLEEVLQSITLEDLRQRKLAREQQIMYYI